MRIRRNATFMVRRSHLPYFVLFSSISIATSGVLISSLLLLNWRDPLLGAHASSQFSTDLFAAFIPGGHWRFADLTRAYWEALPGNIHESSVYVGLGAMLSLAYLLTRRSNPLVRRAAFWWAVLVVFWILSLGTFPIIWGQRYAVAPLPYAALRVLIPPLALSGVPVRMMVMVTLAVAVLSSIAFGLLFVGTKRLRLLACALLILVVVDNVPKPLPATPTTVPAYVTALATAQGNGGVLDLVNGYASENPNGESYSMYYQTVYQRPLLTGYVSRLPTSTSNSLLELGDLIDRHDYTTICQRFDVQYVIVQSGALGEEADMAATLLYHDPQVGVDLFDLQRDGTCIHEQ
jgi:hypothetical protein